jgi:DNA-binding MarR family transcriptional regulator
VAHDQSARFRSTRAAHRDETAEDYVEAVMQIAADRGEARVTDLARLMGVTHVTVTRIIGRLVREGLVEDRPYKPIALTAKGKKLAARILASRDRRRGHRAPRQRRDRARDESLDGEQGLTRRAAQ